MTKLALAVGAGMCAVAYPGLWPIALILLAVVWYGGDLEEWLMTAEVGLLGFAFFDNPFTIVASIPVVIVLVILSIGAYPSLPPRR